MGKETKIMKNAKKPPRKVSNLMKMMNYMLYTVFIFQILIISVFASVSVVWISEKGENYSYLDLDSGSAGPGRWVLQLLTYWVAYSHMIPISLYVIIEVLKLVQSYLVKWDVCMYDEETKQRAECRNSDLVEELGQVDFIFSDKTGTLTCNKMLFKRCSVGGRVYAAGENETGGTFFLFHVSSIGQADPRLGDSFLAAATPERSKPASTSCDAAL
jgi:phospholipid-transporting ATPase